MRHGLQRRSLLRLGLGVGLGLAWGAGLGTPALRSWTKALGAAPGSSRRKLLHLVIAGGWDGALGTDPITPAKVATGTYDSAYESRSGVHEVDGKPDLKVGEGLLEAIPAFAMLPTAFVNGIFMEVSAHEIALNYMLSGVPSLSRSREFPSLAARVGARSKSYPPHVVIGRSPPLGDTRASSPPLQSMSTGLLSEMLKGPGSKWVKPASVQAGNELVASLDAIAEESLTPEQRSALAPWRVAGTGVEAVYARNLNSSLAYSAEIKSRYLGAEDWQGPGAVAGAFLALKAGLAPYVTVGFLGDFDTHSNHFARHIPQMTMVARTLSVLAADLASSADPDDPTKTLAQTTLVLISSEFVRTPKLNAALGTDHWQSGSAILMGAGVNDGVVVGRTGPDALALGWKGGSDVGRTTETALLPEHLIAAVLSWLGFPDEARDISRNPLQGVLRG